MIFTSLGNIVRRGSPDHMAIPFLIFTGTLIPLSTVTAQTYVSTVIGKAHLFFFDIHVIAFIFMFLFIYSFEAVSHAD